MELAKDVTLNDRQFHFQIRTWTSPAHSMCLTRWIERPRPIFLQLWSFKKSFLNYTKLTDLRMPRLWNCDRASRAVDIWKLPLPFNMTPLVPCFFSGPLSRIKDWVYIATLPTVHYGASRKSLWLSRKNYRLPLAVFKGTPSDKLFHHCDDAILVS